ncbi:inactive ubiquitin carboxyl-terminal hydrolase MINDY-4B [Aplysia californica]|uniref:Ubiquitin carboxyl-terminal hydrolase MINDY n=1 Tax=Aplysia californica TaxID=6500 RepID=A0ABM1ABQ5_APLCA|nr:inactive ubiquitin carboxyl-terminal hydrolase MINDY-4B [Aplysia californica]
MAEMKNTSLAERDQLNRLLKFLETEATIGPGNDPKRRTSFPMFGRRSMANATQMDMAPKRSLANGSPLDYVPSIVSPPLTNHRMHTVYVDGWSPVAVKRGDTILFPSGPRKSANTLGGVPICLETAIDLRKIVYGTPIHSFSREWRKSTFEFMCIDGQFPYGIQTLRCGARGLALCVQAYMLKQLIFDREYKSSALLGSGALCPNEFERRRALIGAICEILWQAGEKKRCCVCLKEQEACFGPDYRYKMDGITEKLQLFEFKRYEDLQNFVKRNLEQFQSDSGNGCILFLYSLVLSRTIQKVKDDLQEDHDSKLKLLTDMEDADQSLINLALTGRATPHMHNGDLLYDSKGQLLPKPVHGIKSRSQAGFLFWDKGEDPEKRTEVGSMLKTPKNPIWVTKVNGLWGLVFSLNPDLVSDWRVENRFTMWYYTGLVTQVKPTLLSIETRIGRPRPKTGLARKEAENKIPPLEQCIMTKWYGADIKWNGTLPFI